MSEQGQERRRKVPPIAIVGIILAALFGISLYIRIALPYDQIFVNDGVWFRETDAYYYMRNIENLVHNFPHFNPFDPYVLFPGGGGGLLRPFFAWFTAGIIRLVSIGTPTLHTMESIAAHMPAILGTLTLIPVYFIGKELFNRWVGVIAAALVVILPGEFLHRSLLGFADHHAAEVLFSSVIVLFLIMAIKRAREREISFSHIRSRDWSTITKPLIYTLLAGIFLGLYLLTWQGGLMFIFVIFAYLVVQFIVDHLRRKSNDYLCIIGTPVFLIAFLMLIPVLGGSSRDTIYRVSLSIAVVAPIVLGIVSRFMVGKTLRPIYYPVTLLGLLAIGLVALRVIDPSLFRYIFDQFGVFTPGGASLTILEVQPLTAQIAWGNFTTSFFISFIAFAMLIYLVFKEKSANITLFLVWSIIMLMAALGQRRFGYYYAVNAALLTGYFSWKILDIVGLRKLLAKPKEVVETVRKFKKREKKSREKSKPKTFMQPRGVWIRVIVVGVVIFFAVFFPNISHVERLGRQPNYIMNEGWYSSCQWLKDNSPEPFDDPDFYYELYPPRSEFRYPETAYGVMSWWDYGYFIMQVGHRIPNANPTQSGATRAGQFFTAQNQSSINDFADEFGSKYVMIDNAMATGKFYAMVEWAGGSVADFYEIYYQQAQDGSLMSGILYYPAYYKTAVARLYNFDGEAVVPTESLVISYEEAEYGGEKYKEIIGGQSFASYEEAEAYVASQTSGNYRIVGTGPFDSPVPLEALTSYERVHSSGDTTSQTTVKIFKYLGSDEA